VVNGVVLQDHWHPVVDRLKERVRSGRNDGERPLPLLRRGVPGLVQAGEQEKASIVTVEPDGPACFLRPGLLEESICRHHAPALFERLPKRVQLLHSLRPSIGVVERLLKKKSAVFGGFPLSAGPEIGPTCACWLF
jgi:hypothetical protein